MSKKNNISDLLKNVSFLKWLRKEKGADYAHWEQWQQKSTTNSQLKKDAALIDKGIPFKEGQKINSQASWDDFSRKLEQQTPLKSRQSKKNWFKIAASVAILLIAGLGLINYFTASSIKLHETKFAETETIILPDGTKVFLGANSKLAYYDNFGKTQDRTVQLDGEAFFKVVPQLNGHSFKVSLKDLEVEVIGTEFNVNSHRAASIISLLEGKIELTQGTSTQSLQAGQTAFFNQTKGRFEFLDNQTDYWSAWTTQTWIFENTPIKEINQRIEETLGLTCVYSHDSILQKMVTGEIEIENQQDLFESLAFLLSAEIKQEGQQLFIKLVEEKEE